MPECRHEIQKFLLIILIRNAARYGAKTLPLIFYFSANNFLGGVALAFVYGYFGTFEGTLLNYYPIKASMILVDPTCGAEYGYTYHIFPAFITIVLTFLISVILANKKKEPSTLTVVKKKKAVRKKGW